MKKSSACAAATSLDTATEHPSSPSPCEKRAGQGAIFEVSPLPNPLPTPSSWGEGPGPVASSIAVSRCTPAATFAFLLAFWVGQSACLAWDYDGHRLVNQLALASLPASFPSFARTPTARERIAFLGGEPDRWRNTTDPTFSHVNGPDHYFDLEELVPCGLDVHNLPRFRYDFAALLTLARVANPEKFKPIDPNTDRDRTRPLIGFLPWAIVENFDKLKSQFSYLKTFEAAGGTRDEIANARENIIYTMGVMGHYVGDAAQPLHTTIHHHGWVGENPNGYTTESSFHSWIDGGYFQKIGGVELKDAREMIQPARLISMAYPDEKSGDTFAITIDYLLESFHQVEPLYQLQKSGKLSGDGPVGLEGKAFLTGQLVRGGQMLGDLWFTAWQQAPIDNYLKNQLAKRSGTASATGTRR